MFFDTQTEQNNTRQRRIIKGSKTDSRCLQEDTTVNRSRLLLCDYLARGHAQYCKINDTTPACLWVADKPRRFCIWCYNVHTYSSCASRIRVNVRHDWLETTRPLQIIRETRLSADCLCRPITWHRRRGFSLTRDFVRRLVGHRDVVHGVQVVLHGLQGDVRGLHSGRERVLQDSQPCGEEHARSHHLVKFTAWTWSTATR